ncbi:piggyBac transposable element-derived protein 4-like [Hydra vulgaris]|uniref:PiggyBac transposable element-derived protein 4-like n=1 Tax=Hydra vulgaris TaxID=6087 RepID=A0ABM4C9T6_HYDVU
MWQFLGVLLHMGCVKMPSLEHYWSKNSLYRVPLFSRIMPRNKFQLMLRFWHFVNNEDSGSRRLCKIIELLDHLNNTMDNIYCPNKNILVDESMMPWKGRLVFRQYVKNKRHRYGIKFYELCESDGIVLKVKIYSGEITLGKYLLGQTGAIILDLMEKFLGKDYHLTDRKSNPKECTKAKLKQRDVISRNRESVVVAKWKDKRDVLMINILHSLQMIEVTNRRGEKKMKPNIIKDYNQFMLGVDRGEQMVSYYDCLRKTIIWYKKVALHLFDTFLFNAYCLNSKYGLDKTISLQKFRELIVTDLLGERLNEMVPRITKNNFHYLSSIPRNEKKKFLTKPCRVCSKIKRKETRYECAVCENSPLLCIGECFRMLWIAFGTRKHFRYIAELEMAINLRPLKSKALPAFYEFTGSDTTTTYCGNGKKFAWSTWCSFNDVTEAFFGAVCNS